MFDIQFSSKSRGFLKKIDVVTWKRIIDKIEGLRNDPFPNDVKRVEGRKDKVFRVRVGDYRILYIVGDKMLFISIIDKRSNVY